MKRLIAFFVDNHVFTISVFGALMLFGGIAALNRGVDLFPSIDIPIVAVLTQYPGAAPEEVSREVTEPIESALATLGGVTAITSTSYESISSVVVQFSADNDLDAAAVEVSQRVNALLASLPEDVSAPSVQKFDPADTPILSVALVAAGRDLAEVQEYAEDVLAPNLLRSDGVASVDVTGPSSREVQVLLRPTDLETYGISALQVVGAIQGSAVDIPAGTITLEDSRLLLTGRGTPTDLSEVADIRVDPVRGVRVSDLATVRDAASEVSSFARYNGESVILLDVRKAQGANTVATAGAVREQLADQPLPEGYEAAVVNDTSAFIASSVQDTILEMLIAALAVSLIVLVFVGRLGTVFAVVLAIPVSLAGALIFFQLLDFTFNIVTLLAITVAIGLVIDDAIVVAENIDRYRAKGLSMRDAVIEGASGVATAVLAATMSLLAVFVPISFLPGVIGGFFREFGITLAAAIGFSYLEAMFFLTMRLALSPDPFPPGWRKFAGYFTLLGADFSWGVRLLRSVWFWLFLVAAAAAIWTLLSPVWLLLLLAVPLVLLLLRYVIRLVLGLLGAISLSLYRFGNWFVQVVRDLYVRSLAHALNRSWLVLAAAGLLLASVAWVFPQLGFQFQPSVDSGFLEITAELPQGSTLGNSNQVAQRLERRLVAHPAVEDVLVTVGSGGLTATSTPERIYLIAGLKPASERELSTDELQPQLQELLQSELADRPEVSVRVAASDAGLNLADTGISVSLGALDRDLLQERAERLIRVLNADDMFVTVDSDLPELVTERVFRTDPVQMDGTGLTNADVYQTLRLYNVGLQAGTLRPGGAGEQPIVVKADPARLPDELALGNLPISAPALQSSLPLSSIGSFVTREAPAAISRTDQLFSATVTATLAAGVIPSTAESHMNQLLIAQGILDEDVVRVEGAGFDLLEELVTFGPIAFGVALLLNYLAIGSQFNSFRYPIYLLLTVPLALIGALWTLWLFGMNLDVISVLGVVMLVGIVTKNAILLLDVVLVQAREGVELKKALLEAAHQRFRPIVMTTATILVISLPLLLGIGEGSELREPLGYILLGGVLSSALLTFYVIPAAFYTFERKSYARLQQTAS